MGVSLNSFAAELILSAFGKDQTSRYGYQANRNFPKFPLEVYLSFEEIA